MHTVWKFLKFPATQILREINFRDFRSENTAILTFLKSLKFDFNEFLHYLRAGFDQKSKFRASKTAKMAIFETLKWQKMISRKI